MKSGSVLKGIYIIWLLILFTVSTSANSLHTYTDTIVPPTQSSACLSYNVDSIVNQIVTTATIYSGAISNYQSDIYVKGRTKIQKSNILIRLAHHLFPVDRKAKDMVFEMVSESEYNAPNNYTHKFKAINGNKIPNRKKQQEVFTFLNLNIYNATIYDEGIITPVADGASKYYDYSLVDVSDSTGIKIFKICFTPKQSSQKLVSGYMYIRDGSWTIDQIDISGRFSFAVFNLKLSFSRDPLKFILPLTADLTLHYNVLGNSVISYYHSSYTYNQIAWIEKDDKIKHSHSLDLTQYYEIASDSVPIIRDTTFWQQKRDLPLTAEEEYVLTTLKDTVRVVENDSVDRIDYLEITENITSSMNWSKPSVRIRYSGILNPFQLGYSGRDGITYKQRLRIYKSFDRDRQLRFSPEIGYMFKRKELFFKVPLEWEYLPEKMGTLSLTIANDNQTYSSDIMETINEHLKDSLFTFDDLNLSYFRHYYVDLRNNIELFNGFTLSAGLSYHLRTPVKRKSNIDPGEAVEEILNDDFNDFTPVVGISYTPRQYYWMDGHRKVYAYSNFPTFSVEFARGIPGVLGSLGNYARIEGDVHQSINIGLLRLINYHISAGMYTRKKSTYFADFRYFARRNFPESWTDGIGGVFNLLNREWYNASDQYIQAHFMYQSPFILFQLFKIESSKFVISERFYASQLWTPVLPSYTEFGYGVGNHVFNIAAFISFNKLEYDSFGFKFAFELFQ